MRGVVLLAEVTQDDTGQPRADKVGQRLVTGGVAQVSAVGEGALL